MELNRARSVDRKLRVVVEGWRFIEHSYALACQWQCLSLLGRTDIDLRFIDKPLFDSRWQQRHGIFSVDDGEKISGLKSPVDGEHFDVAYRMNYPHDFRPHSSDLTFLFSTAEYRVLLPSSFLPAIDGLNLWDQQRLGIVTPAHWNVEAYLQVGIPPERIFVVPLGIDPNTFRRTPGVREKIRAELGLSGIVFMNAGAMTRHKGIDSLIMAFAKVAQNRKDVHLLLKGTDQLYSSKEMIKSYIDALPEEMRQLVQERLIYVTGALSNQHMASLYQAADVYVSPYVAEGFNLPVLEAIACGLPVICTGGGPTDDFIRSEFGRKIDSRLIVTSLVNEKGVIGRMLIPDPDHLVDLMQSAIDDEVWRSQAGIAGSIHAHANFSWERVTNQLVNVFCMAHGDR